MPPRTALLEKTKSALAAGDLNLWGQTYHQLLFRSVLAEHGETFPQFDYDYGKRHVLYAWVNEKVLGGAPVDFLEFGVYRGDSLIRWSRINTCPESRFFGFDTFEGLPEDWLAGNTRKGGFDVGGTIPDLPDPRVRFVKGLFQETLPGFLRSFQPRNRLVLHLDADLYSSTLFALMSLNPFLAPGSILVFDEFIAEDEFAALHAYCRACMRSWRIVAARRDLLKIALEIVS